MKNWFAEDVELTVGQLVLVITGCAVAVVIGALWLNGELWQYGMPLA